MTASVAQRICFRCGKRFDRNPKESPSGYSARKYCSRSCSSRRSQPNRFERIGPKPHTRVDTTWQDRAACTSQLVDRELFFHRDREDSFRTMARDAEAKQICASCPVIAQCLHHALTYPETAGVWGGMSETERAELLKRKSA